MNQNIGSTPKYSTKLKKKFNMENTWSQKKKKNGRGIGLEFFEIFSMLFSIRNFKSILDLGSESIFSSFLAVKRFNLNVELIFWIL
jgi:hypothetical protein